MTTTVKEAVEILIDTKCLLEDLLRCGDFYSSAIEIDSNVDNPVDGEDFHERVVNLLHRINGGPTK